MTSNEFDPRSYIDQFNVLGIDEYINCNNISHILYAAILNKFLVSMTEKEYEYFREYQERVYDLVENIRELPIEMISQVLYYLDKVNPYLVDIVIMLWCMPRADSYFSKRAYHNAYKANIKKYNDAMVRNIEHETMKKFCIETLSKTNNVPVHCIDYLWYYINNLSFDFTFYNYEHGGYIGFKMPDCNSHNNHHSETDVDNDEFIEFGLNLEYLLEMGLGRVVYENDPSKKGSFANFMKIFLTDISVIEKMLTTPSKVNYQRQMLNISNNPTKYFGDMVIVVSAQAKELFNMQL